MDIELTIRGRHSDISHTVENITKIEVTTCDLLETKVTLTTLEEFKNLEINNIDYKFFGNNKIVAVRGEELKLFVIKNL